MAEQRRPNVVALVLLGIVAVALVAVVIGLVAGGDDDDAADITVETRDVEISGGEDLVPYSKEGVDEAVGLPAPVLTGETFAGDAITIPDGEPALIVFLAHWCPHCQREVPYMVDWLEANGMPEGVQIYGVATNVDADADNYPPSEWLEREAWTLPTLVDAQDSGAAAAYGLTSFPYFVAVDANGLVVARASGELVAEDLQVLIDAARGGSS